MAGCVCNFAVVSRFERLRLAGVATLRDLSMTTIRSFFQYGLAGGRVHCLRQVWALASRWGGGMPDGEAEHDYLGTG
jgi:hypothetical protein